MQRWLHALVALLAGLGLIGMLWAALTAPAPAPAPVLPAPSLTPGPTSVALPAEAPPGVQLSYIVTGTARRPLPLPAAGAAPSLLFPESDTYLVTVGIRNRQQQLQRDVTLVLQFGLPAGDSAAVTTTLRAMLAEVDVYALDVELPNSLFRGPGRYPYSVELRVGSGVAQHVAGDFTIHQRAESCTGLRDLRLVPDSIGYDWFNNLLVTVENQGRARTERVGLVLALPAGGAGQHGPVGVDVRNLRPCGGQAVARLALPPGIQAGTPFTITLNPQGNQEFLSVDELSRAGNVLTGTLNFPPRMP